MVSNRDIFGRERAKFFEKVEAVQLRMMTEKGAAGFLTGYIAGQGYVR
jgi:hypothetical protein